jgi:hypothetical protein
LNGIFLSLEMAKMVCDKIEYNVGYSQPVGQRAIQNVKGIKIKGAPASSLQPHAQLSE